MPARRRELPATGDETGAQGWAGPDCCDLNEIVAYNFRCARLALGWTQAETAVRLEPVIGRLLTQAGMSSIETAYRGRRRREFDAHELSVFAEVFGLPVTWFLLPPPGDNRRLARTSIRVGDLHDVIFGRPDQRVAVYDRLRQLGVDDREAAAAAGVARRPPAPACDDEREQLAELLLALVYHQADPLQRALERLGPYFEPLRRVGVRRYLSGHVEPPGIPAPDPATGETQTAPAAPAGHD